MSHTMNLEVTANIDGGTPIAKGFSQVDDAADQWSIQIAAAASNTEIEIDVDKADISGLVLSVNDVPDATTLATLAVTVKVNDSTTPEQTFTCYPNKPGFWTEESPFPTPIASGVAAAIAKVFVSNPNTVPVIFTLKLTRDATP